MVYGAPDGLHGKRVALCLTRTAIIVAMLNDWAIEAGDTEGAYLNALHRDAPIYMRMPAQLWEAMVVPSDQRAKHQDLVCIWSARCAAYLGQDSVGSLSSTGSWPNTWGGPARPGATACARRRKGCNP